MEFSFKGRNYDTDSENDPVDNWPIEVKRKALKHYFIDPNVLDNVRKNVPFDSVLFDLNVISERVEKFLPEVTNGLSNVGTYSAWVSKDHDDNYTLNAIIHDDLIDIVKEAKTSNELKNDIIKYASQFEESD